MKKLLALVLALLMVLSLAACGKDSEKNSENGNNEGILQGGDTDQNEDPGKDDDEQKDDIIFQEMVVVDNEECTIKITGIDADNFWGYTIKAFVENKSSDKSYMFSVDAATINGIQCEPLFATEVAPGKKSNEEITFFDDALEGNGIDQYTDIELAFRVYNIQDWLADPVAETTVHIYPYGEDQAVKFQREAQPTDNVLIDNEDVTVIVTGYEMDEIWGYTVKVFFVNKTDKDLMFSVDEASVNGFMADPFFATAVSADRCAFAEISWMHSTLEENGITEVENIEFKLTAIDANDWMADALVDEDITLNP